MNYKANKYSIALSISFLFLLSACGTYPSIQPIKTEDIHLDTPRPNESVGQRISILGEAKGTWFFEASFPVHVEDDRGNIIKEHYAETQDEWMTEEFVPFKANFELNIPYVGSGTLVIKKANPSDSAIGDQEIRVPILIENNIDESLSEKEKQAAEIYIKNMISDLSPEKEVLGGTFYVTNIEWENSKVTVTYEDGHIELVANAIVKRTEDGGISVLNFEILK
ncbi:hypothetical protein HN512_04980 [Candidatus Peregrinibacteria bacterium]|jgi:hypothetical protein|nr:hypothetical protein [Candidatus Peregrinibacteria bacterium]MBT3599160.1 hypothetical protein [Candidatus Peregrinibacteria bacterium]MBT4366883.1 hypothetical protein [Candidatus Peregrinibacteria bacterium]MBT4586178.1 hypothetical protein [Candidatus Peregrinibacteria bacterium]MBT6730800.1 hypothetical protein [Candidatus Peregrinibacteria bacterium]